MVAWLAALFPNRKPLDTFGAGKAAAVDPAWLTGATSSESGEKMNQPGSIMPVISRYREAHFFEHF